MQTITYFYRAVLATAVASMLAFTACQTTGSGDPIAEYNANPLSVTIPDGVSSSEADRQSALTLANRGWSVTSRESGSVTGQIAQGRYQSTVNLKQEGGEVRIYVRSGTYRRSPDAEGRDAIPRNWLNFLQRDLTARLATAALGEE